ncbi:MAG: ribonuclease HII [Oscillibacter sp.]|jgi:ribonuclease HII|nr:ribonuclease HII [Oscillibacter sp.]
MSGLEHPWDFELAAFADGWEHVCGVDEAGAGPLAGPVCAAAVILPRGLLIEGLDDSKKLTAKKREQLYDVICSSAEAYAVAYASAEEIDALNILNARILAMDRAVDALDVKPDFLLVDGNRDHGSRCSLNLPRRLIVHGDGESISIAAASVLAKVSRDRYVCQTLDARYPQYQFARHKGYGTALHYALLDRYGPCPAHRRSFLKKWEAGR